MQALVLSGGSIKGAFQAGVIRRQLESGFQPEIIYGISVGALNGAFLTDRAGRTPAGQPIDWPGIGKALYEFWEEEITEPASIVLERSRLSLAWRLFTRQFDGTVRTAPLRALIQRQIVPANLVRSGIRFSAGAVNVTTGQIMYATPNDADILEYIIASTAMPIAMPLVIIQQAPYYDGGLRDVAPLGKAIADGASEIICISCYPGAIHAAAIDTGDLLCLFERVSDIVNDEILTNDLKQSRRINKLLAAHGPIASTSGRPYRRVNTRIIRPSGLLNVDLRKFTRSDITAMLEKGYESE